jgi:hypothetical protein
LVSVQFRSSVEIHSLQVSKYFSLRQSMFYLDAPFHMCCGTGLSIVLWGLYLKICLMVMKDFIFARLGKWTILWLLTLISRSTFQVGVCFWPSLLIWLSLLLDHSNLITYYPRMFASNWGCILIVVQVLTLMGVLVWWR